MQYESERIEYKSQMIDDIYKPANKKSSPKADLTEKNCIAGSR